MSVYITRQDAKNARARWKRKNREAQLKRTIARLTSELAENAIKNELAKAIITHVVKSRRQVTITGTLAPHYYCLTEITATPNSTSANTY